MITRRKKVLLALCACGALGAAPCGRRACAIEVSLEHNKIEKEGIGYVDLRLLFKLFPDTRKAKLSFEDALHQTEEQINLRRAEIIGLRAAIARLQAERGLEQRTPLAGLPPAQETNASRSSPPPNIPGAPQAPAPGSAAAPGLPEYGATAASLAPGVSPSSAAVASPAAARPRESDLAIAEKAKLLEIKEADFKTFESQAEKSLLDLESRKTEILLGKIYAAIQEVAKAEGVAVVLDKSQILFGRQGVDLTGKVLQRMKDQ